MAELLQFLQPFVPDPVVGVLAGGAGVVVGLCGTVVAAGARRRLDLPVPDTRKIFHFIVFTGALGVHLLWDTPGAAAYGSVIAVLVSVAVFRGRGDPLFEALARPTDAPRRGTFVVVPLVATAVGGVVSNLLAGSFAMVGYLVAGWGDAVAEPVGTRWGRHPYRVPSFGGVSAERSLEGTASVFLAGGLAAAAALALLGYRGGDLWAAAGTCAVVAAGVEAVSHHGLDNFTLQVAASWTAAMLLS